jgi:hypothetical protein
MTVYGVEFIGQLKGCVAAQQSHCSVEILLSVEAQKCYWRSNVTDWLNLGLPL